MCHCYVVIVSRDGVADWGRMEIQQVELRPAADDALRMRSRDPRYVDSWAKMDGVLIGCMRRDYGWNYDETTRRSCSTGNGWVEDMLQIKMTTQGNGETSQETI